MLYTYKHEQFRAVWGRLLRSLLDNLEIIKTVEEVDLDHSSIHSQGELFDIVESPTEEPLGGAMLASTTAGNNGVRLHRKHSCQELLMTTPS